MPDEPLEKVLRRIIREELGAVEERLDSLEKRVTDGFAWTEEQFEWVGQRFEELEKRVTEGFEAVDRRFEELTKALEGLIDEDYPLVDHQRSGGPAPRVAVAAKGGS